MNVFISQTTGKSQEVAKTMRDWLREEMRLCDPWMSTLDIKGGDNWREEIHRALKEAQFGIIFLTAENVANPWIVFEAGLLNFQGIKIFPFVMDLDRLRELPAPINHLQGRRINKDTTQELVLAIHSALNSVIPTEVLLKTFESQWGSLEEKLKNILDPPVEHYDEIIDDFTAVFLDVNKYRTSLDFSMSVDEAIALFQKQNNEIEKGLDADAMHKLIEDLFVDSVYKLIEEERKPFDRVSKLVGKVGDFFREHFNEGELRNVIVRLSPIFWSNLPFMAKREELLRRIKFEESEVYLHYHQILLNKLRAHIVRK